MLREWRAKRTNIDPVRGHRHPTSYTNRSTQSYWRNTAINCNKAQQVPAGFTHPSTTPFAGSHTMLFSLMVPLQHLPTPPGRPLHPLPPQLPQLAAQQTAPEGRLGATHHSPGRYRQVTFSFQTAITPSPVAQTPLPWWPFTLLMPNVVKC